MYEKGGIKYFSGWPDLNQYVDQLRIEKRRTKAKQAYQRAKLATCPKTNVVPQIDKRS